MKALHSHMKKEIDSCQSTLTAYDLVKTRGMRRISICLMAVWLDSSCCFCLSTCLFVHLSSRVSIQSFVFISISYPIYLFVCFLLYLPACPVDILFSGVYSITVSSFNISSCPLLQVCHQFCVLRFGDGSAEVRGESLPEC